MVGIYHNADLDGFACGAIMRLKYPDITLIGYNYGDAFDLNIVAGRMVIMADVSLPMEDMVKITRASNYSLTWVDHHISAINDYKQFVGDGESFCRAILENGIAACEGLWKYLFPEREMPESIKLLGEYDTWRNKDKQRWDEKILPFQFGMRSYCNSVDTFPTEFITTQFKELEIAMIIPVINMGKAILKYQSQVNALQCRKAAFESVFNGLRAICLNGGGFNSNVFDSVYDEAKHDLMIPFQYDGNKWIISLYTTKDEVDCSVIAKVNGGGGHRKASGFQVSDIKTVFPQIAAGKDDIGFQPPSYGKGERMKPK